MVTTIQSLMRGIAALSDESIKKLADYIDDLIDEQAEVDDIAYIDARRDEPTIPFEEVLAKHEAEYGPLGLGAGCPCCAQARCINPPPAGGLGTA